MKWTMAALLLSLCWLAAAPTEAQTAPRDGLDSPIIEAPHGSLTSPDVEDPELLSEPEPSPGWERGLLLSAGAMIGLPMAIAAGALAYGLGSLACIDNACGYGPLMAALFATPLAALVTLPTSVFLMGNLSGRGADFGWTLLGGVLGALPGAAVIVMASGFDESNRVDPGPFYAGGAVLSGVGAITGSIIAFEASSRPVSAQRSSITVRPGFGSLAVSGTFD